MIGRGSYWTPQVSSVGTHFAVPTEENSDAAFSIGMDAGSFDFATQLQPAITEPWNDLLDLGNVGSAFLPITSAGVQDNNGLAPWLLVSDPLSMSDFGTASVTPPSVDNVLTFFPFISARAQNSHGLAPWIHFSAPSSVSDSSTSITSTSVDNTSNKKFRCSIDGCDKAFTRDGDKLRHEKSLHRPDGKGSCPIGGCKTSGFPYCRPYKLKDHLCTRKHKLSKEDAEILCKKWAMGGDVGCSV